VYTRLRADMCFCALFKITIKFKKMSFHTVSICLAQLNRIKYKFKFKNMSFICKKDMLFCRRMCFLLYSCENTISTSENTILTKKLENTQSIWKGSSNCQKMRQLGCYLPNRTSISTGIRGVQVFY